MSRTKNPTAYPPVMVVSFGRARHAGPTLRRIIQADGVQLSDVNFQPFSLGVHAGLPLCPLTAVIVGSCLAPRPKKVYLPRPPTSTTPLLRRAIPPPSEALA